ncbi:MAG TPA: DUF3592 domain-containing protein [Candidatus Sulfotelmatobacter sp.]|nr:DUF3592 domain-containing protein [Candidatus Sulfotelmatobacter sp.]
MYSALEFTIRHFVIIGITLYVVVNVVIAIVRSPVSSKKAANWPTTEATIQSVGAVAVSTGRSSYTLVVGDFSYIVNDDYYSGRVTISRSFSTGDRSPKELVDQKLQVRYNPGKPGKYFVPQAEIAGFLLDPYDEGLGGTDIGPTDLELDKI